MASRNGGSASLLRGDASLALPLLPQASQSMRRLCCVAQWLATASSSSTGEKLSFVLACLEATHLLSSNNSRIREVTVSGGCQTEMVPSYAPKRSCVGSWAKLPRAKQLTSTLDW
jgi:hypothetical protein